MSCNTLWLILSISFDNGFKQLCTGIFMQELFENVSVRIKFKISKMKKLLHVFLDHNYFFYLFFIFLHMQEEPKSRKPVGGVSMFGGLDLFANKLKKAGEKTEEKLPAKKTEAKKTGTLSAVNFFNLLPLGNFSHFNVVCLFFSKSTF